LAINFYCVETYANIESKSFMVDLEEQVASWREKTLRLSIMATALIALLLFASGCSWFNWQKIPNKEIPAEKIECKLWSPILDTIVTAGSAVGAGVSISAVASYHCDYHENDLCGLGVLTPAIAAGALALVMLVYTAASATGWLRYQKCLDYNERVSASERLGTGPQLFYPPPPSLQAPPNPESPPVDKQDGDSK
jgi:hypothetical protein